MGATSLFTAFEGYLKPEKAEADLALRRAMSCATALTNHFYGDKDSSEFLTLIGSTVKDTCIRPISDIDLVFHLPAGTYTQYDAYAGNGQSALLQEVRSAIAKRYPDTVIKGDGPVVMVQFASGPAVEVVPGVLYSDASILDIDCSVPITRDGGKWEATDYGAHFDAFHEVDRARSRQMARLMRYAKAWRREKSAVIRSIMLEVMAVDFFNEWDTPRAQTSHTYDDWLVRDFLGYMIRNQDTTYQLPGSSRTITAGYGWRRDASDAFDDATTACAASDESVAYVTYWRKVLGSGFGS
ncbi:hypothetical protein ACIQLK_13395 [Microbacterium sp. NPDC091382]|uniref:SMODS domain-containing nucleotidyltransferase n=1 Tax=Microbacterium sp. NPDC091382 TaxID=3364210 RepID=UPI0037F3C7CE